GTVTAANSSSISDGAAAVVITRASVAERLGLPIVARVVAHSNHAQAPAEFTSAPVPAMEKALARSDWSTAAVDLYEVNEALAVSLHIPETRFRPGDAPDFAYLKLPKAGSAKRPAIDAPASETRDLAYGLVRVIDDAGNAVGPWNPSLDAKLLTKALRDMMLTRAFDDRMFRMQRQGKTSFYAKSTGEEAVAVGAALALEPSDMCFPT